MTIFYIGKIKSIIKNLEELGAKVLPFVAAKQCDGVIVTSNLSTHVLQSLHAFRVPIIVSGKLDVNYTNINVLVLNEQEAQAFYKKYNLTNLQSCKDKLKTLGIKYLVISLNKDQIKQAIQYQLPKVQAQNVKITDADVIRAKDVITAIVGYVYIKKKKLSAQAIKQAQIGAALAVTGLVNQKELTDYYLGVKLNRKK
jgi:hypothetical protein